MRNKKCLNKRGSLQAREMVETAKKGFTLLELIVTIAIILVLAFFITPNVVNYTNKAQEQVAYSNAQVCYRDFIGVQVQAKAGLVVDDFPRSSESYTNKNSDYLTRHAGCYYVVIGNGTSATSTGGMEGYIVGPHKGIYYYLITYPDGQAYGPYESKDVYGS